MYELNGVWSRSTFVCCMLMFVLQLLWSADSLYNETVYSWLGCFPTAVYTMTLCVLTHTVGTWICRYLSADQEARCSAWDPGLLHLRTPSPITTGVRCYSSCNLWYRVFSIAKLIYPMIIYATVYESLILVPS